MPVRLCLIFWALSLAACSIDVSLSNGHSGSTDGHSSDPLIMGKAPGLCNDGDFSKVVPLDRDNVLIWGNHTNIGPCSRDLSKILDINTGQSTSGPKVMGQRVSVSDGNGGWYVSAAWIDGRPARAIEHIRADGTVDPSFEAFKNSALGVYGTINDLKLAGGRLYVAGDVRREINRKGGPVDLVNGDAYYPQALSGHDIYGMEGALNAVASDGGSGFYIAGEFREYRGERVGGLIHVDANGQRTSSLNPTVSGVVDKLLYDQGSKVLYLMGSFWAVNGEARFGLAAIDTMTGSLLNWNPVLSGGRARDIAVSSKHGRFFLAGYVADEKIEVLDLSSGAHVATYEASRSDGQSLNIDAVHAVEDYLYVGGYFTSLQGVNRNNAGAIDLTTGNVASWNPNPAGGVYDIASSPDGSEVFLAGAFYTVNGQSRSKIASVHPLTAAVNPFSPSWNPTGGAVYQIAVGASAVYASGLVDISASVRNRFSAFDRTTGSLLTWDPTKVTGMANSGGGGLAVGSSSVFILDQYIGQAPEGGLFVLNAVTGEEVALAQYVSRWSFQGATMSFSDDGSLLFFGSADIINVGATQRWAVAAFNTADLTFNNKTFAVNNGVVKRIRGMEVYGNTLYVGGYFTSMGANNLARQYLAAVDIGSGNATAWNPNPDGEIRGLYKNGTDLYVYGSFTSIMGQARAGFAVFDLTNGTLKSLEIPSSVGDVQSVSRSGDALYVSGGDPYRPESYRFSLTDNSLADLQVKGCSYSSISGGKMIVERCAQSLESGVASSQGLTVLNLQTRQLQPLDINLPANRNIQSVLRISANKIALVGTFEVAGENYGLLVADLLTKEIQKIKTDGDVYEGVIYNDIYYMRGAFTEVEGKPRSGLAAVSLTDLSVLDWSPVLTPTQDNFQIDSVGMIGLHDGKVYIAYNAYLIDDDYTVGRVQRFDPVTGMDDSWSLKFNGPLGQTKLKNGVFSTTDGDFTSYNNTPVAGKFLLLDLSNSQRDLQDIAQLSGNNVPLVLGSDEQRVWYIYFDASSGSERLGIFNRTSLNGESAGSYLSNLNLAWFAELVEYDGFIYVVGSFSETSGEMSTLRVIRKSDGAVRY